MSQHSDDLLDDFYLAVEWLDFVGVYILSDSKARYQAKDYRTVAPLKYQAWLTLRRLTNEPL